MPKAIIRVYLLDGRWKAVVVDADLYTRQCIPLIASKLILTGKEDFSDYFLFESLDNGRVVNELPGASKPFDITQKWGPKSGNVNRFVFKRRTDKLKLYDTAFESQWRSSLIEDKTEIPKQQNLLAATRQTNQNSSPTVTPPISPRKEEEIIESPREEPQQEPAIAEPPKRKLPPGAQPLFFVGAKMVLPPAPKQRESSNFHDPMTSPRQVVTVDHSEIQNKRGNLKEKQNEKQQKLDVHKQSVLTWCNSILEKKNLSMKDLIQDLKSGVMLANILEICTGTTMKFAQNPRLAAQKLDNLSSCLNLLKQHGISVQGCTASDILNGNEPAVVGLMFLVVNKFKNVSSVASNRFSVVLTSQPIVVGAEPTPEPQTNTARDSVKPVPQKTSKPTPVDPAPQETEVPPAVPPVPVEEPQEPEEVPPPVPEPVEPTSDVPPAVPPVPVEEPEEIEDEIAPPVPPVPEEPIEEPVSDLPPVPPVPSEPVVTPYVVPEPEDLPPPLPEIPADFVAEDSQEELPPPVPPVPFPMPEILDQEDYLPEPVIPLPPIIEPQRAPSISKDSVPFIPPIIDPSDQLEAPPPVPPVPEHLMDPGMIDAQFEELNDFLTELANDLGVHTN